MSDLKQAKAFLKYGECTINNVILRNRELKKGETVFLDTDDYGEQEAEVVEVEPTADYYNHKACAVKIKKRET